MTSTKLERTMSGRLWWEAHVLTDLAADAGHTIYDRPSLRVSVEDHLTSTGLRLAWC